MTKRNELQKKYNHTLQKIRNKYNIQPSITLEYIYMKQDNEQEALEMLTQEVQRSLLYNNALAYTDYSGRVDYTINNIINEIKKTEEGASNK